MADEPLDPIDEPDDPVVAVDDGRGGKNVPLSVYLAAKKEAKESSRRLKELEPIAARSQEIDARLVAAQPIIDAIVTNPKLRAEAMRMAQGTRTSSDPTDQPTDDQDASEMASELGMYLNDGTPDTARGRRVLNRMDARSKQQAENAVRPLAGVTLNQRANENLRDAMAQTDAHGVPLATPESIREVAAQLPAHLLADPKVVELVLNNAIGIDRRQGRTPKELDEPLYLAAAGSGRSSRESVLTAEDRDFAKRHGISEKDYAKSVAKLGKMGRDGVTLGGD